MPGPPRFDGLEPCDSLYLSPHADDAALSCPGGIYDESAQGLRVLVATLFGPEPSEPAERRPTGRLGAREVFLGLPDAADRSASGPALKSMMENRHPEDDEVQQELRETLADLVRRARPRHVYAPLGVWGHIDHRLAYAAARREIEPDAGRDVFFYEERPFSLLAGSVRIRLAQLGARLPPAAAVFGDHGSLLRYVIGFRTDPFVRRHFEGFWDAARCSRTAARDWRAARGWNPLKALGPRLQPALHPTNLEALAILDDTSKEFPGGSPFGSAGRFWSLHAAHARRLGREDPLERYWLLLPSRESLPEGVPEPRPELSQAS